jgi:hypothetical protein
MENRFVHVFCLAISNFNESLCNCPYCPRVGHTRVVTLEFPVWPARGRPKLADPLAVGRRRAILQRIQLQRTEKSGQPSNYLKIREFKMLW